MAGSIRIPGGHEAGIAGNLGTAGDTGSPPVRPSASGPQQQPPEGLTGLRVASGGGLAPRGHASLGSDTATVVVAPMRQQMEDRGGAFPGGARPVHPPPLQLHVAQQLIVHGEIQGTESAREAEAARRVRDVQDKVKSLDGRPINWADAMVEMRELPLEQKITEGTFVYLADAAHKSYKADRA